MNFFDEFEKQNIKKPNNNVSDIADNLSLSVDDVKAIIKQSLDSFKTDFITELKAINSDIEDKGTVDNENNNNEDEMEVDDNASSTDL